MASLFGMLLDTMPFAGAAQALFEKYGRRFDQCEAHEVKEIINLLDPGASFDVELPEINADLGKEQQPLWALSHAGSEPAAIRQVYCRVRDADYVGHCVAEKIEWGLEDPVDCFQRAARVTFASGGQVSLPLTPEYVFWKFRISGGALSEDQTRLWRLKSCLDTSLVVVFAYDLDPATAELRPMDLARIQDPRLREEVKKATEAVKQLLGDAPVPGKGGAEGSDGGTNPPEPSEDPELPPTGADRTGGSFPTVPPSESEPIDEPWGTTVMRGDLWPDAAELGSGGMIKAGGGVSGQVGEVRDLLTEPARLLVVVSFTTCCERADFEPGAMVGFARCYPHLLMSATVPVKKIEASAHIDRPRRLAKWQESERDMTASCCKPGHDGWSEEIRSLLVSDANRDTSPLPGPPLPFWSNMFAYDMVDPYRFVGSERMHVVRTTRPQRRVSDRPLVIREVVAGFDQEVVEKEPFQGEFDNVHLAPRLKLLHVTEVIDSLTLDTRFPVTDRKKWRLDEVAMAPFCAHDCLHLHWRWPRSSTRKWTLGWGNLAPYSTAGAPMVPHGQDVWIWFRSDHRITYHVSAPQSSFPTNWTVLMHHGFGYAVSIQDLFSTLLAMTAVDAFSSYYFVDGTTFVNPTESTSVYYWMARYTVKVQDGQAGPVERVRWENDGDLREARDL